MPAGKESTVPGLFSDKSAYIAGLWLEAGKRRREAARLQNIVAETIAEAERMEILAKELASEW